MAFGSKRRLVTLSQGVPSNPDANALFARYATPPSASFRTAVTRLFNAFAANGTPINSSGPWDLAYILAAETEQAALLHAFNATYNTTKVNSPAFTSLKGFNGVTTPSNGYLRTNHTPSTHATKATSSSQSVITASLTERAAETAVLGGSAPGAYVYNRDASNRFQATLSSASGAYVVSHRSSGIFTGHRDSTNYYSRRDGLTQPTIAGASLSSQALSTREVYICAVNNAGSVAAVAADIVPIYFQGANITETQMRGVEQALATFLAEIEALTKPAIVCCDGNSRTLGTGATTVSTGNYPMQMWAAASTGRIVVTNKGVAGQTIEQMLSDISTDINTVLDAAHVRSVLIVWEAINSMRIGGKTIAETVDLIEQYCDAARAAGWSEIYVCEELQATAAYNSGNWGSSSASGINTELAGRYSAFADGLIELSAITELQDPTNATYFPDGIHLSTAGYGLVAARAVLDAAL